MNQFIQELQQRGVIRVLGLYGAVFWLLLQASDVLFPAFEIPDSAVRYLLFGGLGLLPIVATLTWFYEITDRGIQLEEDVRQSGAKRLFAGSQFYFLIIGLLAVALSISVYLNLQAPAEQASVSDPEQFVSVLIADIDNQTKDPLFDGSVEEALTIGIEGAAFITTYNRNQALNVANELNEGASLDSERARLVAVREGINFVLLGTIALEGSEYTLTLGAMDPRDGTIVAEVDALAENKLGVLQAVGTVATRLRAAFGDANIDEEVVRSVETFSTGSLKAMQLYADAQRYAQQGDHEQAIGLYEQATLEDPRFGRAYSGWALSAYQLGQSDLAGELWNKTLPLIDGMTEREKFRTLGLYYLRVSRNPAKAVENYGQLVEKFPADNVGRNNLAVSYFLNRQFDEAMRIGREAADMDASSKTVESNYVLYAMYAGDFDTVKSVAGELATQPGTLYKVFMALAVAELASGNFDAAVAHYERMQELGAVARSLSLAGLADSALTVGNTAQARQYLEAGIESDKTENRGYYLARKYLMLARIQIEEGSTDEAVNTIDLALEASTSVSARVMAALLYLEAGATEPAAAIAEDLSKRLPAEERSYAKIIQGMILLQQGDSIGAVDTLTSAAALSDSWLTHLSLGKAYHQAEAYAEALSEFEVCRARTGEATALFMDDLPTFHSTVELNEWTERTRSALGM